MQFGYRLIPVLLLIVAAMSLYQIVGAAQASTPEATPTPGVCSVQPRPVSFIADILAAPEPQAVPTAVTDIPLGVPVDEQTRAEVLAVLDQLYACVNAGDYLRSFALFDDEYLRRIIDPEGLMTEAVAFELGASFATPEALDEDSFTTLVDIISIEQLSDGSVVLVFRSTVGTSDDATETVDLFVFAKDGESWRIVDGLTDVGDS